MNVFRNLFVLAILASGTFAVNQVAAQGPGDVFDQCTRSIAKLTRRHQSAISDTLEEGVPLIKRLLNAGQTQRARDVAARCIKQIHKTHETCQAELRERCERCARVLVQMGAPNLAREILARGRRASNRMNETHDRAVAAIRGLF